MSKKMESQPQGSGFVVLRVIPFQQSSGWDELVMSIAYSAQDDKRHPSGLGGVEAGAGFHIDQVGLQNRMQFFFQGRVAGEAFERAGSAAAHLPALQNGQEFIVAFDETEIAHRPIRVQGASETCQYGHFRFQYPQDGERSFISQLFANADDADDAGFILQIADAGYGARGFDLAVRFYGDYKLWSLQCGQAGLCFIGGWIQDGIHTGLVISFAKFCVKTRFLQFRTVKS